jgi:hypothetical protein
VIEKFNFYDVYGYFLPGLAFLGVLWLPVGFVAHLTPAAGWTSAVVVGAAAYIMGHLLQAVATSDLPSKFPDAQGKLRYPSVMALDTDSELSSELKDKLETIAKQQFGLDVGVNQTSDSEIDRRRNDAFFLARQVLIREKAVSYSEQFQGMYALMRGLSVVFSLALTYWLGWVTSTLRHRFVAASVILVLTIALLVLINISFRLVFASGAMNIAEAEWWRGVKRKCRWIYLLVFFTIGYAAGYQYKVSSSHAAELSLLAGLAFLASLHTLNAYRYFAGRFAVTIWRDFLAYNAKIANASNSAETVQDDD